MKYFFFTIHKTPKRDEFTAAEVLPILHAHTAYFKRLGADGKCLLAGPFANQQTEFGAGCYVFAAESETEARARRSRPFCRRRNLRLQSSRMDEGCAGVNFRLRVSSFRLTDLKLETRNL